MTCHPAIRMGPLPHGAGSARALFDGGGSQSKRLERKAEIPGTSADDPVGRCKLLNVN